MNLRFLEIFEKYSNFMKSVQWEPSCSMRRQTYGRTDRQADIT